jgi:hypothetical protein
VLIDSRNDAWLCFALDGTSLDPSWERSSWQQFSRRIAERLANWVGPERLSDGRRSRENGVDRRKWRALSGT